MSALTRDDVVRHPSGLVRRGPVTTAHHHLARFYHEAERQHRGGPSWVERIAAAPSPFAVEGLLADFRLFGGRHASEKVRAQVALAKRRARTWQLSRAVPQ